MAGRFLLVSRIGRGAFGTVYLGLQAPVHARSMRVAVKYLSLGVASGEHGGKLIEKFNNEIQALAVLGHPNIVRLIDHESGSADPFLVMELVENARSLEDIIQEDREGGERLPIADKLSIVRQLLDALEAAHGHGIIHRDLKPANILVQAVPGNRQLVRVVDFGLAKFFLENEGSSHALGSPTYMAPEQFYRQRLGPWTDLYAVALITLELLVGIDPFANLDMGQLMVAKKAEPQLDAAQLLATGCTKRVVAFLQKATARSIDHRYASVAEFRAALASIAGEFDDGRTVMARPALLAGSGPRPKAPDSENSSDDEHLIATRLSLAENAAVTARSGGGRRAPTRPPIKDDFNPPMPVRTRGPRRRNLMVLIAAGVGVAAIVAGIVLAVADGDAPVDIAAPREPESVDVLPSEIVTPIASPESADTFNVSRGEGDAEIDSAVQDSTAADPETVLPSDSVSAAAESTPADVLVGVPVAVLAPCSLDGAATPPKENSWVRVEPVTPPIELPGVPRPKGTPPHGVSPLYAYEIQSHEVTWREWRMWAASGAGGKPLAYSVAPPKWLAKRADVDAFPVTGMLYADAVRFCNAIAKGGDLPSEAEWEYAARGPTGRRYPWGDGAPDLERTRTRFAAGEPYLAVAGTCSQDKTPGEAPGGGVHDLFGNARELVRGDWLELDGTPWKDPDYRIVRGSPVDEKRPGSDTPLVELAMREPRDYLDSQRWRKKLVVDYDYDRIGFRCVRRSD